MTRGGKRPGAGRPRKPVLDDATRLRIGAEAEKLWDLARQRNRRRAIANMPRRKHIAAIHAKRQRIALSDRQQYLTSKEYVQDQEDLEGELWIAAGVDDMDDDGEDDVDDDGKDDVDDAPPAPRVRHVKVPRPKGVKPKILQCLSQRWTRKLNKQVTCRMVESCWREVRQYAKQADKERNQEDMGS